MNGGQLPTNQLHDIKWGALNYASRAPQLMSCNYYVCVCMCVHVCVHVCMCITVCVHLCVSLCVHIMCVCMSACACMCECTLHTVLGYTYIPLNM